MTSGENLTLMKTTVFCYRLKWVRDNIFIFRNTTIVSKMLPN